MYGVAFTQSCDNDLVGILLFKHESKAKLAYRVMIGMDELDSLDPNVSSVLDSSDFDEIPEVEEDELHETIVIEVNNKRKMVRILNATDDYDIPDLQ